MARTRQTKRPKRQKINNNNNDNSQSRDRHANQQRDIAMKCESLTRKCSGYLTHFVNRNIEEFQQVPNNERIFGELVEMFSTDNFIMAEVRCTACNPQKPYKNLNSLLDHASGTVRQSKANEVQKLQHEYMQYVLCKFIAGGQNLDVIADVDFRQQSQPWELNSEEQNLDAIADVDFRQQSQPWELNSEEQNLDAIADVDFRQQAQPWELNSEEPTSVRSDVEVGQKRAREEEVEVDVEEEKEEEEEEVDEQQEEEEEEEKQDQQECSRKVQKMKFQRARRFRDHEQVVWPPVVLIQGIVVVKQQPQNPAESDGGVWSLLNVSVDDLNELVQEDLKIPSKCIASKPQFVQSEEGLLQVVPTAPILKYKGQEYGLASAYVQLADNVLTQTILLELYRAAEKKKRGRDHWWKFLMRRWKRICRGQFTMENLQAVFNHVRYIYEAAPEDIYNYFPSHLQQFQIINQGMMRQIVSDKYDYYHNSFTNQRQQVGFIFEPFFSSSNGFNCNNTETDAETIPETQVLSQDAAKNCYYEDEADSPCVTEEIVQDTQVVQDPDVVTQQGHMTGFEEGTDQQETRNDGMKVDDECYNSQVATFDEQNEVICTQKFIDFLHNQHDQGSQSLAQNTNINFVQDTQRIAYSVENEDEIVQDVGKTSGDEFNTENKTYRKEEEDVVVGNQCYNDIYEDFEDANDEFELQMVRGDSIPDTQQVFDVCMAHEDTNSQDQIGQQLKDTRNMELNESYQQQNMASSQSQQLSMSNTHQINNQSPLKDIAIIQKKFCEEDVVCNTQKQQSNNQKESKNFDENKNDDFDMVEQQMKVVGRFDIDLKSQSLQEKHQVDTTNKINSDTQIETTKTNSENKHCNMQDERQSYKQVGESKDSKIATNTKSAILTRSAQGIQDAQSMINMQHTSTAVNILQQTRTRGAGKPDKQFMIKKALEELSQLQSEFILSIEERRNRLNEVREEIKLGESGLQTKLGQIQNEVQLKYSGGRNFSPSALQEIISAMEQCKQSFLEATNRNVEKQLQ